MRYCIRCLLPNTKPDLTFNAAGVCSACTSSDERKTVNWEQRANEFEALREQTRHASYDCVVPVSGGKDSTWQVLKARECGFRVLAVTAMTDHLSEIGRHNLDNISKLGVDHIMVQTNPVVRAKIARCALTEVGDISWAEHVTIFSIPARVAIEKKIPFVFWGENPQVQYGAGTPRVTLDRRWLEEFGGLNGLRVADLIDAGIATADQLQLYTYPSHAEEHQTGVWMGQYFLWDGLENANLATQHGWRRYPSPVESSGFHHENLDNLQTGLRDYLKFLKFGFGRATDMASSEIRAGRMTRQEALQHVRQWDGRFPHTYLGVPLEKILDGIDMTVEQFKSVCDRFTNKKLFRVGNSLRPEPLFEVC